MHKPTSDVTLDRADILSIVLPEKLRKETVMKILWTLSILISLCIPGVCADEDPLVLISASDSINAESGANSELKDALENFSFEGKPVHPGCVREFDVALSDSPPPIVRAVDIKACVTSNEFYMPFKTREDGYIGYEYDLGDGEKGSFSYKYLGKSDSGIHVLDTRSSGGGTMVAESVFLIKSDTRDYWDFDNQYNKTSKKRLIMICTGQITIGDRDRGTIDLSGNQLILGPSQYRDKAEAIDLD